VSVPPLSIAILGNDALLAAAPALPVQLMHAALAAGFDAVVPVSLGEELVAGETLRLARLSGRRPVVQCACPFSLSQLCNAESNLGDVTVAVAPAPVALARALRLERNAAPHITYIGACPGAQDPAIDLQVLPSAFLRGLQQRGIYVSAQPDVFADRVPPDRRRFLSIPGGAPRSDLVESVLRRTVTSLGGRANPLLAVADALFDGGVTMIDPAGAYNCICAGADSERSVAEGRAAIEALEPMRSATMIFEAPAWLDLRPTAVAPATETAEGDRTHATVTAFADAAGFGSVERSPAAGLAASAADPPARPIEIGAGTLRRVAPEPHVPEAAPLPAASASRSSLHAPVLDREVPLIDPVHGRADRRREAAQPLLRRGSRAYDEELRDDA
jgi:hypothetical protein